MRLTDNSPSPAQVYNMVFSSGLQVLQEKAKHAGLTESLTPSDPVLFPMGGRKYSSCFVADIEKLQTLGNLPLRMCEEC